MNWKQRTVTGGWSILLLGVAGLTACGGGGSTSTPDASTVARADHYTVEANANQLQIPAPGILANDMFPDGTHPQITLLSEPQNGTLLLQQDGSFLYTGAFSNTTEESFTYRLESGDAVSEAVTVTLSRPTTNSRTLPVLGIHPGGIAYWDNPYLADAMATASWLEFSEYTWGSAVQVWNNPQFDDNGYPRYLNPGFYLRAMLTGLHMEDTRLVTGHVVLTWKGNGDLRLSDNGDRYLADESNGEQRGSLLDGRRVYRFPTGDHVSTLEIRAIDPQNPITEIHVWLADPSDPQNRSLEGQTWHPRLLQRLADFPHSVLRTMDLSITNSNPQQDWADRRRPEHYAQTGVLNPRSPAPGALAWNGETFQGNRSTGMAWEYLVDLANQSQHDLWINVPHLATTDYVDKLVRLIRYGSDGHDPYPGPVANPRYPPLDPGLRVWVESSNEIWAGGEGFAQGEWAAVQAAAEQPPITKAQFNARRFCDLWQRFNQGMGDSSRVVKVLSTFTASSDYDGQLMAEVAAYCPTLAPQLTKPDVIAVTTYTGNGIQDWAHEKSQAQAGTADPWFYTSDYFDAGLGLQRPVSRPASDGYWQSAALQHHLDQTLDEWKRRILSGDASQGEGPDATGWGGGFQNWVTQHANQYFQQTIPLIAYEGGPSIYTDNMDGGDERDDGITSFMVQMNNRPMMAEIYRMHLNMAAAKGLQMHNPYTLSGAWGKYGQWGHLGHLADDPAGSVKYQAMLQWLQEERGYNPITAPQGAVPTFDTAYELEATQVNATFERWIRASGGDGTLRLEIIGSALQPGIEAAITESGIRIWGSASQSGTSYLYAKVSDNNGDRGWRIFTLRTLQRSTDPEVSIDFEQTPTPAFSTPLSEPFVVNDTPEMSHYQFMSRGNPNLLLEHAFPDLGWFEPWPSTVLLARHYSGRIRLERDDGRPFDLYSLDLASTYGKSAVIRAEGRDGYLQETTINLPLSKQMTPVTLDLIEVFAIEVRWYLEPDAQGEQRMGAIDNLRLNHRL